MFEHNQSDLRSTLKQLAVMLLVSAMFLLIGCETMRKPVPTPKKPVAEVKPTVSAPTVSVPVVPVSGITMVEPRNYMQEKKRIKQELAKNSRDSLSSAEVGYYLDVLQGRLKQITSKNADAGVGRKSNVIVVILSRRTGFESNNNQISSGIREILAPLSSVLVEYRMMLVTVKIVAESSGPRASNPVLSEQRAQAVARYLLDAGVSNKRIMVIASSQINSSTATAAVGGRENITLQLEPIVRATSGTR